MDIKILGPGCPKCQYLEKAVREVAGKLGVDANIEHVTEMSQIMSYPVVGTPALVVNGEVKVSGHLPSHDQIAEWLKA